MKSHVQNNHLPKHAKTITSLPSKNFIGNSFQNEINQINKNIKIEHGKTAWNLYKKQHELQLRTSENINNEINDKYTKTITNITQRLHVNANDAQNIDATRPNLSIRLDLKKFQIEYQKLKQNSLTFIKNEKDENDEKILNLLQKKKTSDKPNYPNSNNNIITIIIIIMTRILILMMI